MYRIIIRPTITGKPTSPIIEKNIKYLVKKGTCMVGIRSTINNMNLYNQIDNIRYFVSLGVNYIWTDPFFPSVGEKEACEEIDILKYAKEYLKAKKYADKHHVFYGSFLACNFSEKTKYHCKPCLPVPYLTTDGYVSAVIWIYMGLTITICQYLSMVNGIEGKIKSSTMKKKLII